MMFKPGNCQQGIHKRSLASVYHLFEVEDKSPLFQCPAELNDAFTDVEGKDVFVSSLHSHAKGVRLVRSQSFPPEGWYKTTSKYILKIRKNLDSNAEVSESHSDSSGNVREDVLPCRTRMSELEFNGASPGHTFPVLAETACVLSLISEHNPAVPVSIVNPSVGELSQSKSSSGPAATTTVGDAINVDKDIPTSIPHVMDAARPVSPEHPAATEESASANCLQLPASVIPPSGKLLVCGRRREMEDTAAMIPSFLSCGRDAAQEGERVNLDWHFYGVFDGHGGLEASTYCMERLHQVIAEELIRPNAIGVPEGGVVDSCYVMWEEVMKAAFSRIDKEVGGVCPNAIPEGEDEFDSGCLCCEHAIAPENVGTTAVVAIVGSCQIVVANCGDSRAVLGRGGQAMPLSRDHKPELEDETTRIEAAGGRVICWDGYRVGGLLALSRAIGDRYLKRFVISEPETRCIERSEEDECLILASDGLWDVVSNEFACEVARKSLPALRKKYAARSCAPGEDAASAAVAALLVKLAYGRGSKDNISVVVVDLKSREVEHQSEQG